MPTFSIILPVFNAEKTIDNCIEKLLNQTYRDFELIIIDDGSKDNSLKICYNYSLKDNRIRIFHKENSGAGPTRNYGLKVAKGKYIFFPDADDWVDIDLLEKTIQKMIESDIDLIIFGIENIIFDDKNNIISKVKTNIPDAIYLTQKDCYNNWNYYRKINIGLLNSPFNKIYKMDIIKKYNILFPSLRRTQDAYFNLLYYDKINSMLIMNDVMYHYNVNNIQKIGTKFPKDVVDCFIVFNKKMVEMLIKWEIYDEKSKVLADNNLLGCLIDILNLCKNPIWNFTIKQKLNYISKIVTNNYIHNRFCDLSADVYELIKYINLIKNKKVIRILFNLYLDDVENYIRRSILPKSSFLYSVLRKVNKSYYRKKLKKYTKLNII